MYRIGFEARFAGLTRLEYHGLGWGAAEAKTLAATLASGAAPRLRFLSLDGNVLGCAGTASIAEAMPWVPLQELRLGANCIRDDGAKALAAALEVNGVLKKMNVEHTRLGDAGKRALRDAVRRREGFELLV